MFVIFGGEFDGILTFFCSIPLEVGSSIRHERSLFVFRGLPVPVIACLHGMCFGGGKFEEKICTASLFLLNHD
jgi:hypothetical protein